MSSDIIARPYDSAFKSVIHKIPGLVLPLINEMFFKHGLISTPYVGTEKVTLLNKELSDVDSNDAYMDLLVSVPGRPDKSFHLECQSVTDHTMVLRMVQYDVRYALDKAGFSDSQINIHVNDSGVLFLRAAENTPDIMTVNFTFPQMKAASYEIPVMKMKNYSLGLLLERGLYVLLPFIFFNYEKLLKRVPTSHAAFDEASETYQDLVLTLVAASGDGRINAYEASTIYDAAKVVLSALGQAAKAGKEVEKIMGARILEFSADKYFNAGKDEGKAEGKAEGKVEAFDTYGTLITELNRLGRSDDIIRSASDPQFRNQLLAEFHLIQDAAG